MGFNIVLLDCRLALNSDAALNNKFSFCPNRYPTVKHTYLQKPAVHNKLSNRCTKLLHLSKCCFRYLFKYYCKISDKDAIYTSASIHIYFLPAVNNHYFVN